jgi:hypothetical protein
MIPSRVGWLSKASKHLSKAPSRLTACSWDGDSKRHIGDRMDRNIPEDRTLQGSFQANAPFGQEFLRQANSRAHFLTLILMILKQPS